jgi:hypothetical protein
MKISHQNDYDRNYGFNSCQTWVAVMVPEFAEVASVSRQKLLKVLRFGHAS